MFLSTRDEHHEKTIMQLRVMLYFKGEEIVIDSNDDLFYDCVCTDLLGNVVSDEDPGVVEFKQRDNDQLFTIKKNILVFSFDSFVGDCNFYDYVCGLQWEYENIGLSEILGIDDPDGLYYLAKDIVPLFKDHIKKAKDKNEKTFSMNLPIVWSYSSRLVEDYWSGGIEGESDWEYLGILDMHNVPILDCGINKIDDFKEEDIVWE